MSAISAKNHGMMICRVLIFLGCLMAVSLGGCASNGSGEGVEYALQSINGEAPPVEGVTLTLRDGDVYGSGPINFWQASVADGKVGPMIMTRRGGAPHEMEMESKLVPRIEGAQIDVDGDTVTFTKDGETVVFSRE